MRGKRGSQRDYFKFKIKNRKGQFFILAAVIIAVIILGLGFIYNTVNVSESSNKFYSYSTQLNKETGAVVDYSLYTGNAQVEDFVNKSVNSVLSSYPELDVFTCYTVGGGNTLTCVNYGSYNISIYFDSQTISIDPGKIIAESGLGGAGTSSSQKAPKSKNFNIGSSSSLTVDSGGINYSIDLADAKASSNQYYFIFRANTSAGNSYSDQGGG